MLKVDFERTEIKGSEPHILTEFTMLARNLRKFLAMDQSTEYGEPKTGKDKYTLGSFPLSGCFSVR